MTRGERAVAMQPRARVGGVEPEAVAAHESRRDGRLPRARRAADPQDVPQTGGGTGSGACGPGSKTGALSFGLKAPFLICSAQ